MRVCRISGLSDSGGGGGRKVQARVKGPCVVLMPPTVRGGAHVQPRAGRRISACVLTPVAFALCPPPTIRGSHVIIGDSPPHPPFY